MIWILSILLSFAHGALLNKVGSCKAGKDARQVLLIKQWHLSPRTQTKGFKEKYPQEKNQSAIYIGLADKIKSKKLALVVAEGCEGEINDQFVTRFNGWDYSALKAQSQTKNYPKIITHVPLKLEARYQDKILTVCGDSERLIQEGNLRISNLRGWAGFWSRLTEKSANPEKLKLYSEAAAELLKVPKDTPPSVMLPQIKDKIRSELELFQKSLSERNDGFVKALQAHPEGPAAIVIGGLHADDLKAKLEAAGFGCDVIEPSGYQREDEELVKEFQRAMKE